MLRDASGQDPVYYVVSWSFILKQQLQVVSHQKQLRIFKWNKKTNKQKTELHTR